VRLVLDVIRRNLRRLAIEISDRKWVTDLLRRAACVAGWLEGFWVQ
jgi:hypothetical protein